MKKLQTFLTVFFSILLISAFSQPNTFNKIFTPNSVSNSHPSGHSIIFKKNNYLINVHSGDSILPKGALNFIKLDSIGNIIKTITFTQDSTFFLSGFGSFIQTNDSGYFYAGECVSSNLTKWYHHIIKFNHNMDTLWSKKIFQTDSHYEMIHQVCETLDKNYVIVGEKNMSNNICDVLLIKIDSFGNQIWEKTISSNGLNSGFQQIKQTSDNGFLIYGLNIDVGNPFIMKTDSVCNLQWCKYPNSQFYNQGGAIAINKKGNYLIAFGLGSNTLPPGNTDDMAQLYISEYTPQGALVWDNKFEIIGWDLNAVKLEILPDSNIVVLGDYDDFSILNNPLVSFLAKIDITNHNLIWKTIFGYTLDNSSENLPMDFTYCPDGGFAISGLFGSSTITQKVWFVKTDSMGYVPGMQYVGIKDLNPYTMVAIKAFPNPTTNQTTISYPQLINEGELQIYNILGQLVYEEKLTKATSQKEINIQNFNAGLYKVIIKEKGIIKGQVGLIKN